MCLAVPVVMPDEDSDEHTKRQFLHAKRMIHADLSAPAVQENG